MTHEIDDLMQRFREQAQEGIDFRGEGWADIDSVKALVWDLNCWLRAALEQSAVIEPPRPEED